MGRFYVYILARPDGSPFYVGKGSDDRIDEHERDARRGVDDYRCRTIRAIWRAGSEVSKAIIFQTDDEAAAYEHERITIERIGIENLTNVSTGGRGGATGRPVPDHLRQQLSERNRLWKRSPETLARMSAAARGKGHTAEARAKMSAARQGRQMPAETREKIGAAQRGRRHSPERVENMRRALTGRKLTPEHRANVSAAGRGRSLSPEHRQKIGAALRVLTADQARQIRQLYATGGYSQRALGAMFGVSKSLIKNIVLGQSYPDAPADVA